MAAHAAINVRQTTTLASKLIVTRHHVSVTHVGMRRCGRPAVLTQGNLTATREYCFVPRGASRSMPSAAVNTGRAEQLTSSADEITVEEVMNPHPVVLKVDTPVKEAVRLFLEKDISGAPVVDKDGKLVGVISESDLIWKGVGTPQDHFIVPPFYIGLADLMVSWRDNTAMEEEIHKILARTVGEAMNSHPVSVPPKMAMSEAATLMVKKKINRLPVIQDGKVVGVISRHDILMGLVASNSPFL